MSTAEQTPVSRNGQMLIPPDERFWKHYSPHFELPLASMAAIFAHGLVIGILAIGGIAYLFSGGIDALRPPPMDVVLVNAKDFPGDAGGGAPAGAPGLPGDSAKTDDGAPGGPDQNLPPQMGKDAGDDGGLPPVPGSMSLTFPASDPVPDGKENLPDDLKSIVQGAEKTAKGPPQIVAKGPRKTGSPKRIGTKGFGNPKGVMGMNGQGGIGTGPGGPGPGGGGGQAATEAEIKAWRWEFDLKGGPKEHADKLDRAGLILAIPDPQGRNFDPKTAPLLFITDLKRRPAHPERGGFQAGPDTVKWFNRDQTSITGLAQELRLPRVPPYLVLLLPKDREARMAAEEQRFAQQNGNDVTRVQKTLFDFRLQNGMYEPTVLWQR